MLLAYRIYTAPRLICSAIWVNASDVAAQAQESELSVSIIPSVVYFTPQNTQVIELDGLQDSESLAFVNDAAVSGTLIDDRGNPDPVFNNIPMLYQNATNGNYVGTVPDTFNALLGSGYRFVIQATAAGVEALWTIPAGVRYRTNT